MKILFVSHSSVLKYHQQKLEILASKFKLDITLVTPPAWNEGGFMSPVHTGSSKISYETGKTIVFKKRMIHFYLNAAEMIKRINPDIVHIEEEPFSPACWQFLSAAKKAGKKTVFFTWENIERKHNPVYTYFDNYCIKNADAAIAGNEDGRQILLKKGFKGALEVIPQYGVNLEDFKDRKAGAGKDGFNLVYIGRLTPEKGIETITSALRNTTGLKLNVVGGGPSSALLHKEAHEAGIADKAEFHAHVDREQIPEFLSKMDILILPSLTTKAWKEQFGRVLIEAMAAKVPVIGSDSGEIPNVIGGAGLVFREGSVIGLKAAIDRLTGDSKLYKQCMEHGYKRVKENYTNEVIAAKIYEVYNKL
jgi:glycosyltransferase involved in cell wall biosynthesis